MRALGATTRRVPVERASRERELFRRSEQENLGRQHAAGGFAASTPPSLRAQRSNPGATLRGPWIASSQGLLAMTDGRPLARSIRSLIQRFLFLINTNCARVQIRSRPIPGKAGGRARPRPPGTKMEKAKKIWKTCNPLKSHKTNKTFLEKTWPWNHTSLEKLAKSLEARSPTSPRVSDQAACPARIASA